MLVMRSSLIRQRMLSEVPAGVPSVQEVDASTTAQMQVAGRASSVVLGEIQSEAMQQPAIRRAQPYTTYKHLFGPINEFSDAASRNDEKRLQRMAAMMGITPVEVPVHPDFHAIVMRIARIWQQMRPTEQQQAEQRQEQEDIRSRNLLRHIRNSTPWPAQKKQKARLFTAEQMAEMRRTTTAGEEVNEWIITTNADHDTVEEVENMLRTIVE